jgi:hypothetical protein
MRPETTEDILEILDGYVVSAALGAAMELGLFWSLAEKPLPAPEIAKSLYVPLNRCHHWLQLLCKHGLLENSPAGYTPSVLAQEAILNAQSQSFWAFHAQEDRRRFLSVRDLALNLHKPMSAWEAPNLTPPDELQQILEDPDFAARFTRMLCEIHLPLAEQVANLLDLQGVKRLLDLGGGSTGIICAGTSIGAC